MASCGQNDNHQSALILIDTGPPALQQSIFYFLREDFRLSKKQPLIRVVIPEIRVRVLNQLCQVSLCLVGHLPLVQIVQLGGFDCYRKPLIISWHPAQVSVSMSSFSFFYLWSDHEVNISTFLTFDSWSRPPRTYSSTFSVYFLRRLLLRWYEHFRAHWRVRGHGRVDNVWQDCSGEGSKVQVCFLVRSTFTLLSGRLQDISPGECGSKTTNSIISRGFLTTFQHVFLPEDLSSHDAAGLLPGGSAHLLFWSDGRLEGGSRGAG